MLQEFVQNINKACKDTINGMIHTAMPGKIISVDAGKGMAVVQPAGMYKAPTGKSLPYPQISGVPIIIPQCHGLKIEVAFPVKPGDSCLIIISEQELDAWLYGEESESELRFDLTSAICIPGLSNIAGKAFEEACNTESIVLANNDIKIMLSKSGITAYGDINVHGNIFATGTVKAGNIDLKTHTHTSSNPGSSSSGPK